MATEKALTSPISQTATQYRVDVIALDQRSQMVTVELSLLDAAGAVVSITTVRDTFANAGFSAAGVAAVEAEIINYLKGKGLIN